MTKSEVKALLVKWQKKLGLQDWLIIVDYACKPDDFADKDNCGECEYHEVNKIAKIRIIDPVYYGDRVIPFNFKQIFIHELLHIKFCFIDNSNNPLQDRLLHSIIEDLAKAFLED